MWCLILLHFMCSWCLFFCFFFLRLQVLFSSHRSSVRQICSVFNNRWDIYSVRLKIKIHWNTLEAIKIIHTRWQSLLGLKTKPFVIEFVTNGQQHIHKWYFSIRIISTCCLSLPHFKSLKYSNQPPERVLHNATEDEPALKRPEQRD